MTTLVNEVPENGTNDQVLKKSGSGFDQYGWETILEVPAGGSTGQVLTKTASGYAWQTPSGGGMQIAGAINTFLGSFATYTHPSGQIGEVNINGTQTSNAASLTINGNGRLASSSTPTGTITLDRSLYGLKLGPGSTIYNSGTQNVRISGYRLSN